MRKIAFLTAISSLLSPSIALAQNITITKPGQGFVTIGDFISKTLSLAFLSAILLVLVMLIWGAFEWMISGGDKEAVGKARGRIINALIGLAVLAVAFALAKVAAQFLGFPNISTDGIPIPTRDPNAQGY